MPESPSPLRVAQLRDARLTGRISQFLNLNDSLPSDCDTKIIQTAEPELSGDGGEDLKLNSSRARGHNLVHISQTVAEIPASATQRDEINQVGRWSTSVNAELKGYKKQTLPDPIYMNLQPSIGRDPLTTHRSVGW